MTTHGGVISVGATTVLIGGQRAARMGDMHTCPMQSPATPPVPHVGGPINTGSATVQIEFLPAARQGDLAICTGPPDAIALGCPTVIIGDVGSGSSSGGGAGGTGGGGGGTAEATPGRLGTNETIVFEKHWVELAFVDAAGLPVSGVPYTFTDPDSETSDGVLRLDGTVRRDRLSAGTCTVKLFNLTQAAWSKERAQVGETIQMKAKVEGFEPGTPARFQVFKRDLTGPDVVVEEIETETQGETVEAAWTFAYPDDLKTSNTRQGAVLSRPFFYFEVVAGPCQARSGLLEYRDVIKVKLLNEDGQPVAQGDYVLYLSDGSIQQGKLDGSGSVTVDDAPIGPWSVRFPGKKDITVRESKAGLIKQ